jgi:hypothetical protein
LPRLVAHRLGGRERDDRSLGAPRHGAPDVGERGAARAGGRMNSFSRGRPAL